MMGPVGDGGFLLGDVKIHEVGLRWLLMLVNNGAYWWLTMVDDS